MKWILIIFLVNNNYLYEMNNQEACILVGEALVKKQVIEEFKCTPIDKLT